MVLARSCGLTAVLSALVPALDGPFATLREQLRDWYKGADDKSGDHRRELDVTTCFAPLLRWIFADWPCRRLAVALDATSLFDCLTILSLSVVYRGTAIPVAWKIFRRQRPASLGAGMDGPVAMVPRPGGPELDRGGLDRSRVVRALAVSGDRGPGLASDDADHAPESVLARGLGPSPAGVAVRCPSRTALARSRRGLPHDRRVAVGVHAAGLVGVWGTKTAGIWSPTCHPKWPMRRGTGFGCGSSTASSSSSRAAGSGRSRGSRHPDRAGRVWLAMAVATRWVVSVGGQEEVGVGPAETMPAVSQCARERVSPAGH